MPFDGLGNFTRNFNWVADRDAGIKIEAVRMDGEFNNFAAAMNQLVLRNGSAPMTGDVKLGGFKITGLGDGTVASPSLQFLNSTNTGLYLPSPGVMGLVAAGAEVFRAAAGGPVVTGQLKWTGSPSYIVGGAGGMNIWFDSVTAGQTSSLAATIGPAGSLKYTYGGVDKLTIANSTGLVTLPGGLNVTGTVAVTGDITSTGKILAGSYGPGAPIRLGLDLYTGFGSDAYNQSYLFQNGGKAMTFSGSNGGTLHGPGWQIENQLMVNDLTLSNNFVLKMYSVPGGGGATRPKVDSYFGGFAVCGQGTPQLEIDGFGSIVKVTDVTTSGIVSTKAVKFPAAQVGSGDPNTLDDYERGTCTLDVTFGNAAVGLVYENRSASYVKVGQQVTVAFSITLTNKGTSVGQLSLNSFPFNSQANYPAASVLTSFIGGVASQNGMNGTAIGFFKMDVTAITNADCPNGLILRGSITYITS